MSVQAMAAVFERDFPPLSKLLLLVLADCAHPDGTNIYPKIETVCAKTSMSRNSVINHMKVLIENRILIPAGPHPKYGHSTYTLNLPELLSVPMAQKQYKPACPKYLKNRLISAFKSICPCCNRKGTPSADPDENPWHVHRRVPGRKNGQYNPENIVILCASCHRREKRNASVLKKLPSLSDKEAGPSDGPARGTKAWSHDGPKGGPGGDQGVVQQSFEPLKEDPQTEKKNYTESFETFWSRGPWSNGKEACFKTWKNLSVAEQNTAFTRLLVWLQSDGWKKGFVNRASTWLRERIFDEAPNQKNSHADDPDENPRLHSAALMFQTLVDRDRTGTPSSGRIKNTREAVIQKFGIETGMAAFEIWKKRARVVA